MNKVYTILLYLLTYFPCQAQFNRYIVKFKNKSLTPYSLSAPQNFLSDRAINRRTKYGLLFDSTDLPITPAYIDSIRLSGNVTILNLSKWLNQISISTSDPSALNKINNFPFVVQTIAIAPRLSFPLTRSKCINRANNVQLNSTHRINNINDYYQYGVSNNQVKIHQNDFLHNHGFRGNGMQLALIDDGFYHYNSLPTFDSIRLSNHILDTWDFVDNEPSVSEDDAHGMECLSTIAANLPGVFVGTAPETSFYLFRSEDVNSEYPIEEHNLTSAAERADSAGADICSISLGYTTFDNPIFDHPYSELNGHTTTSAQSVNLAAKKGLLMIIAAGNEGNSSWHFISTPADADSGFAVGAVDTLGNVAYFSSYGPTSDGRIAPSVTSVGWNAVIANAFDGSPTFGNGTSFACPNLAGVATCLWQAFPEASNMDIIRILKASASNSNSPNNRIGFGIPNAKKAFVILQKKYFTVQSRIDQCNAVFNFSVKVDNTMSLVIERKLPTDIDYASITSLTKNQSFGYFPFSFSDNLSTIENMNIWYRFKMIIGTDSTYFLDSVLIFKGKCCNANFKITNQTRQIKCIPDYHNDSTISHFWNFGDGHFSSQDAPIHYYRNCGEYTITHIIQRHDNNGLIVCSDSAFEYQDIILDNNYIYPNPVKNLLNIDIKCPMEGEKRIILQNILGQTFLFKGESIDMSAFPKGIYFVSIFVNNKKLFSKKVLKW